MTPEGRQKLKALLIEHEEYKQFSYKDSRGYNTVGIGINLDTRGIKFDEAVFICMNIVQEQEKDLDTHLPLFCKLNEARQIAILDLAYNVGTKGVQAFTKMWEAIGNDDYVKAAEEILNSQVREQRKQDLAHIMKTGRV